MQLWTISQITMGARENNSEGSDMDCIEKQLESTIDDVSTSSEGPRSGLSNSEMLMENYHRQPVDDKLDALGPESPRYLDEHSDTLISSMSEIRESDSGVTNLCEDYLEESSPPAEEILPRQDLSSNSSNGRLEKMEEKVQDLCLQVALIRQEVKAELWIYWHSCSV